MPVFIFTILCDDGVVLRRLGTERGTACGAYADCRRPFDRSRQTTNPTSPGSALGCLYTAWAEGHHDIMPKGTEDRASKNQRNARNRLKRGIPAWASSTRQAADWRQAQAAVAATATAAAARDQLLERQQHQLMLIGGHHAAPRINCEFSGQECHDVLNVRKHRKSPAFAGIG